MQQNACMIIYNQKTHESQEQGYSSIYRNPNSVNQLASQPEPHIKTLKDVLINTYKKYGANIGIGKIQVSKEKYQKGKNGEVRTVSTSNYSQIYQKAVNLAKSLIKNNFYFEEPFHNMKLIGIHAKNSVGWLITDWACTLGGLVSVPLYDTFGRQNLAHCFIQTQMTTTFVSQYSVQTLLSLPSRGSLKNVISYDRLQESTIQKLQKININHFYFDDLIQEGKKYNQLNIQSIKVTGDDCHTFSYTSGTTGSPKGAMLSHRSLTAFLAVSKFNKDLNFQSSDVYLSYLPLPHVLERTITFMMYYLGATVIVSSGNLKKLKDDIAAAKPTIFVSVPRIYSKIVQAAKERYQQISQQQYMKDVNSKIHENNNHNNCKNMLQDSSIFKKIKEEFGGKIRLMMSSGAPINVNVKNYMKILMSSPLIERYGQTQSSSGVFLQRAQDLTVGHVGGIVPGLQFKLADIPEMKYTADDKDEKGQSSPRGQIWLRGPQIFMGYYKLPDKTQQSLTKDGWLRTGDVGQLLPGTNAMKIIDRKKNIFKLQQGQYIATEKVQAIYRKSPLVKEIFLHGQSLQSFCIAIVVPNKEQFTKFAISKGVNGSYQQICKDKEIKLQLAKLLYALGKQNGLHGFEQALNIHIQMHQFAQLHICTNATNKLQRFEARKYYKFQIQQMYRIGQLKIKE